MRKITVFVLLLAALGLVACSGNEAAKREGTAPEPSTATPASSVSPQLLALLPAKGEVPGWESAQAPRSFTAGNLWEFIDGAADGYLAYGFQEVVSADYTQAGTKYQAVVDIYQMKDALNSFGKYSEERNPEYQFIKVGNEGYSGGTSVNFWAGQYYVKITAFEEKEAIKQEMTKLANAVAAKITVPGAEPRAVAYFPKENQLPHTTVYIPKDVLAQSYFANGFESKYKAGGKEYKIILIGLDNPAEATNALARYQEFLSKGGKEVRVFKAPGDGGFSGKDSFYGNMAAIRAGKNIVVALGAASEAAGIKLVSEVVGNIGK
jgi:hypothetical protein